MISRRNILATTLPTLALLFTNPLRLIGRNTNHNITYVACETSIPEGWHLFYNGVPICSQCSAFNIAEQWAQVYATERSATGQMSLADHGWQTTLTGCLEFKHTGHIDHTHCLRQVDYRNNYPAQKRAEACQAYQSWNKARQIRADIEIDKIRQKSPHLFPPDYKWTPAGIKYKNGLIHAPHRP